jgi:AcrR family transcriptional regulator
MYRAAMARPYELKRRAERQSETRQRIIDATIALHKVKGGSATISEIARDAGVGRVTVYRHFPDEETLYAACSSHYFARHPFPDIERWREIADAPARLREGLRESYAWHDENREMMTVALNETRELPIMAPYHRFWDDAAETLVQPWALRGRRRTNLKAFIALALGFEAHRTLVREQGLAADDAVELVVRLAATV